MKLILILLSLLSAVSAFAPSVSIRQSTTALNAELTATQKEIARIQEQWNAVRLLSREDGAKLEGELKEAYDRFYTRYDRDIDRMLEITTKLKDMIEPPRIQKKTIGQRKRDKWAIISAREAFRAANKKK